MSGTLLASQPRRESFVCVMGRPVVEIRLGYELIYQSSQPTPMILNLNVHNTRTHDLIRPDSMLTDPAVPLAGYSDGFGNWCTRLVAPAGRNPHHRGRADKRLRHTRACRPERGAARRGVVTRGHPGLPACQPLLRYGQPVCCRVETCSGTRHRMATGAGHLRFRQPACHVRLSVRAFHPDRVETFNERLGVCRTTPTWRSHCAAASTSGALLHRLPWGYRCPADGRPDGFRGVISKRTSEARGTPSTRATTSDASDEC